MVGIVIAAAAGLILRTYEIEKNISGCRAKRREGAQPPPNAAFAGAVNTLQ
jgi:hypothetical protein